MNAVLHKNFGKDFLLHLLYDVLLPFKLHFELKHSHTGSLSLIHICPVCLMSRYRRIQKQRFYQIVHLVEFFLSLTINCCPLSILQRCPFYREFLSFELIIQIWPKVHCEFLCENPRTTWYTCKVPKITDSSDCGSSHLRKMKLFLNNFA